MVEQVFLPMVGVWSMHNEDTHVQEERERKPKGRENFLCLKFFLSCYTRSISFHSYQYQRSIYVLRTLDTIEVKKKKKRNDYHWPKRSKTTSRSKRITGFSVNSLMNVTKDTLKQVLYPLWLLLFHRGLDVSLATIGGLIRQ